MNENQRTKANGQIHIISAGRNMNETFKVAMKKFAIERVIVFKEKSGSDKNKDEKDNKNIKEIEDAIQETKRLSHEMDIKFSVCEVKENDINDTRDKVFSIKNQYNDSDLYFHLTHGRKVLSLFLLTMAFWVEGYPYYIEKQSEEVIMINIPRMHIQDVSDNKDYMKILGVLHNKKAESNNPMEYKALYKEVFEVMKNEKNNVPGRPNDLKMGTFSKWLKRLEESQLIEKKFESGSEKYKIVSITPDGEFAYNFMKLSFKKEQK